MSRGPRTRIDRAAETSGAEVRSRRDAFPGGVEQSAPSLRLVEEPAFLVLAILDGFAGRLSDLDRAVLAAARRLADCDGGAVVAVANDEVAQEAADAGADRRLAFRALGGPPEQASAALITACASLAPQHIVFPDDLDGRDLAARLAARLRVGLAMGVHSLNAEITLRLAPSGRHDLAQPPPAIMTVRGSAAAPNLRERFEGRTINIAFPATPADPRIEDLGTTAVPADDVPLEEAPLVMGAGAGVCDWRAFTAVAGMLNAARACTRVISDLGLMSRDRQVGASGKTISADCYLAFGVSGALQHTQGIEACRRVVAVNRDPYAPIVKRADLTVISDANGVLAALEKLLRCQ